MEFSEYDGADRRVRPAREKPTFRNREVWQMQTDSAFFRLVAPFLRVGTTTGVSHKPNDAGDSLRVAFVAWLESASKSYTFRPRAG